MAEAPTPVTTTFFTPAKANLGGRAITASREEASCLGSDSTERIIPLGSNRAIVFGSSSKDELMESIVVFSSGFGCAWIRAFSALSSKSLGIRRFYFL
jgi:hypothetical protein